MSKVYITGHKNPDMDSLCSAIAYAALKNQLNPSNEYIPVRCGQLSDNVKKVFGLLGITPPKYKGDITPTVQDVMMHEEIKVDVDSSLATLAKFYDPKGPSAFPVFDEGNFYGLVNMDDVTNWVMRELAENGRIEEIPSIRQLVQPTETIDKDTYFEEARNKMANSRKRGFAVVNDQGEYLGYITRRSFLHTPKHKVVLVDHNEASQSIAGLQTAEVLEIIDHHRLNALRTEVPIFINAEVVGSTCTIVYRLYRKNYVEITPEIAKILLTGLVSDTLILRSPTTTPVDVRIAHELCDICKVDLQDFGMTIFSTVGGLKNRDPEETIRSDFKSYEEGSISFGVGQCEVTNLGDLDDYKDTYLEALEKFRRDNSLDWAVLMITDIIRERSVLLSTKFKACENLEYKAISKGIYDMPGVLSRKKQLLPEITYAIREMA